MAVFDLNSGALAPLSRDFDIELLRINESVAGRKISVSDAY